jgi:hypothetical protein
MKDFILTRILKFIGSRLDGYKTHAGNSEISCYSIQDYRVLCGLGEKYESSCHYWTSGIFCVR